MTEAYRTIDAEVESNYDWTTPYFKPQPLTGERAQVIEADEPVIVNEESE